MKALIVDDDRVLSDLLAFTMRKEGFQVCLAYDGAAALAAFEEEQPDIIILDVNLPKITPPLNGFMVCARVREISDVPIILLTVRNEEEDIVHGLQMGADDYVLKPFSPRQLTARVQAVLRRAGKVQGPAVRILGSIEFDPSKREVRFAGQATAALTALESRLLECLSLRENQYITIDELINEVWGHGKGNRDMVRQLVRRLRSKIEIGQNQELVINNLPGLGYGLFIQKSPAA